jgi:hypothetical protein
VKKLFLIFGILVACCLKSNASLQVYVRGNLPADACDEFVITVSSSEVTTVPALGNIVVNGETINAGIARYFINNGSSIIRYKYSSSENVGTEGTPMMGVVGAGLIEDIWFGPVYLQGEPGSETTTLILKVLRRTK